MARSGSKWLTTVAALSILIGLAVYLRFNEAGPQASLLPSCFLHKLTGLHCVGCGNTRTAYALLSGDVWGAVQQNAFTVLALPFLAWGGIRLWRGWMNPDKRKSLGWWKPVHSYLLVAAIFAFGILRNVPMKPFNWLAPVPLSKLNSSEVHAAQSHSETPHHGQ